MSMTEQHMSTKVVRQWKSVWSLLSHMYHTKKH